MRFYTWMICSFVHFISHKHRCIPFLNRRYTSSFASVKVISLDEAQDKLLRWSSRMSLLESLNNSFVINDPTDEDIPLSVVLKRELGISTKKAHTLCHKDGVTVNGRLAYSSRHVHAGDSINIDNTIFKTICCDQFNETSEKYAHRLANFTNHLLQEHMNPPVHPIYEDDHVSVIFKPSGIHTSPWVRILKRQQFSVEDCLRLVLTPNLEIRDTLERPTVCHRLDSRVSGCLVVAKTLSALNNLTELFSERHIQKTYRAILVGNVTETLHSPTVQQCYPIQSVSDNTFLLTSPVNQQEAQTMIQVVNTVPCNVNGYLSEVNLSPLTGRRHQLRQHCALLGHPILGDTLYHHIGTFAPENELIENILAERKTMLNEIEKEVRENTATRTVNELNAQLMDTAPVRKGVGIFLMSTGIEFIHPYPVYLKKQMEKESILCMNDSSMSITETPTHWSKQQTLSNGMVETVTCSLLDHKLKIDISPLPKFQRIIGKAWKGHRYRQSLENNTATGN